MPAHLLAPCAQVLTSTSPEDQAAGLRTLLKMQCGDGLMHESVHVDNLKACTRKWFEVRWHAGPGRRDDGGQACRIVKSCVQFICKTPCMLRLILPNPPTCYP